MKNNFISSIWNFSDISIRETNYATHDFLRWYGKLIPQLVSRLIKLYSKEGDLVLANFSGSGTVLLESNILKRDSIGIDSNPLSVLLSTVKTRPHIPDSRILLETIEKIINSKNRKKYAMTPEDYKWFYENSFQDLMAIHEAISKVKLQHDKDYFLLALASIIKKSSKVDARCVNHIVADKNKIRVDIFNEFSKKLVSMADSMLEYKNITNGNKINIQRGDARNTKLPDN